jgi:hypothetical protein
MRPPHSQKIKEMLREHRQNRELLWRALGRRTEELRKLTKFDDSEFFCRFANGIDRYNCMDDLLQNLVRKRKTLRNQSREPEATYTPIVKSSIPIVDRLKDGVGIHWFKPN